VRLERKCKKPLESGRCDTAEIWCPGPDSNRHALRRGILSPLRLPVSPPGLVLRHVRIKAARGGRRRLCPKMPRRASCLPTIAVQGLSGPNRQALRTRTVQLAQGLSVPYCIAARSLRPSARTVPWSAGRDSGRTPSQCCAPACARPSVLRPCHRRSTPVHPPQSYAAVPVL
jgi:hypothetical protein